MTRENADSDLELLEKDKLAYVEGRGLRCPYCASQDIRADGMDVDGSTAWQEVSCNFCQKKWTDLFTLTGITVRRP